MTAVGGAATKAARGAAATVAGDVALTTSGGAASITELTASWKLVDDATMGDTNGDPNKEIGVTIDLAAMVVESPVAVGEPTESKAPTVGDWVLMERSYVIMKPSSSNPFFSHVATWERLVGGNGASKS